MTDFCQWQSEIKYTFAEIVLSDITLTEDRISRVCIVCLKLPVSEPAVAQITQK